MNKFAIAVVLGLSLMLGGCFGDLLHGKDETVAACKSYTTADECSANDTCVWKEASDIKPARCKAKS